MKGGKLIAEGGFGCVFFPAINCNGSSMTSKKYVSKIQPYDITAKNEIEIGKILQTINGWFNHFSPVYKFCNLDIATIEDSDKENCTILKKQKTKKFIVMKLLYVKGQNFIDYIIYHKNSKQIIDNIIHNYNYLLRTIAILIHKNIIHFDFKGNNILFDINKQLPLLIDFGLSIQVNKIKKQNLSQLFYTYAPEYYFWPLEVHYLCFILNKEKEPNNNQLKKLAKDFASNNKGLKNFSPMFIKRYNDKCYKQLQYYNNFKFDKRIEIILNYWSTFDNYSLSIIYLKYINYINIKGYIKNSFIIFFSKLLLRNIDPNPSNRLSIAETLHMFNGFLYIKNINNINSFEEIFNMFINNHKAIIYKSKKDKTKQKNETIKMKNLFKKKNRL